MNRKKLRVTCPVDKLSFMQIGDIITDYDVVIDNFHPPLIEVNTSNYAKDNKFKENGRFMWWASESFWIGFSNIEVIEEGERKMKYELKDPGKSWWVKGMIVEGEIKRPAINGGSEMLEVDSVDICELNKDIMTKEQIIECMKAPRYGLGKEYLEPLETIKMTRLDYELLKFVQKQGAKYICRDKKGLLNLFENKPYISNNRGNTWWAKGRYDYFDNFTNKLFQFVTWESQEYYVIEDVLNNCKVVEDENDL